MTTSADRMRRLRARQRKEAPLPEQCQACGALLRNLFYAPWCAHCWRRTEAGKAWQRERIAAYRKSKRKKSNG